MPHSGSCEVVLFESLLGIDEVMGRELQQVCNSILLPQVCTGNYTPAIARCVADDPRPSRRLILPLQVCLLKYLIVAYVICILYILSCLSFISTYILLMSLILFLQYLQNLFVSQVHIFFILFFPHCAFSLCFFFIIFFIHSIISL